MVLHPLDATIWKKGNGTIMLAIMVWRDTLWKALIEELVEDFLYFFFPTYMDQIDLRRGVVFLDKDLEQIMPEADTGRRHADKLFKVWLNDGEERWFLAHVEVQGYPDADFAFRMFQYYYRILDRYNLKMKYARLPNHENLWDWKKPF